MRWTKDHDLILLKEILLFEPYSQKRGSPERGRVWEQIVESSNGQRDDKILFKVSQRSVRDRFNVLKNNFAKQQREEERASGISSEISEVDECLEDIIERFKEKDENQRKENEEKKERATEDALKAAEMRKRSLETFTESQNRYSEEITPKRTRNNGNDTISYLTAKYESEFNLQKEELALRREEIETTKTIIQQQGQLLSVLVQNQQNQQAAMLSILQKLAEKEGFSLLTAGIH